MSDRSNTGNAYRRTSFGGTGRNAGYAMCEDDYSEDAMGGNSFNPRGWPRFPNDDIKPEELNGPCVIVQAGNKKED